MALALIGQPSVLLLDEPTAGMDATAIRRTLQLIKASKCGVVFTSHSLAQCEAVCDRVVLLNAGRKFVDAEVATLCNGWVKRNY